LKRLFNGAPNLKWWQKEVIYEVYIKSFYDSNSDGVGDIAGISQKLDYLKKIGANTVWLTPFYPSGGKDGGYDVVSYNDIDPVYGTMNDFDKLVEKVHQMGIQNT
jgi:glycosidase